MANKKYYKRRTNKRSGKKSKKKYSLAQRKAYWMGVGAGDVCRENGGIVGKDLPFWKVKDLGAEGLAAYKKGLAKEYRSFD